MAVTGCRWDLSLADSFVLIAISSDFAPGGATHEFLRSFSLEGAGLSPGEAVPELAEAEGRMKGGR